MYEEKIIKMMRELADLGIRVSKNERYIHHLISKKKDFDKTSDLENELKKMREELKNHRVLMDILEQKITKIQEKLDEKGKEKNTEAEDIMKNPEQDVEKE